MIEIPDWLYDILPWIAVGLVLLISTVIVLLVMADLGAARQACADIGMLYNPDYHGCIEGVNIP